MSEIQDMYQELILDHSRSPKNFGGLLEKTHHAHGNNPHCGDSIDLDVAIKDDWIRDISFHGEGCAIFTASSSLMTESIKGKTITQALATFNEFHQMLTNDEEKTYDLGKLVVLQGVKQFPIRVKCATLCWHTLNAALKNQQTRVTTE